MYDKFLLKSLFTPKKFLFLQSTPRGFEAAFDSSEERKDLGIRFRASVLHSFRVFYVKLSKSYPESSVPEAVEICYPPTVEYGFINPPGRGEGPMGFGGGFFLSVNGKTMAKIVTISTKPPIMPHFSIFFFLSSASVLPELPNNLSRSVCTTLAPPLISGD